MNRPFKMEHMSDKCRSDIIASQSTTLPVVRFRPMGTVYRSTKLDNFNLILSIIGNHKFFYKNPSSQTQILKDDVF